MLARMWPDMPYKTTQELKSTFTTSFEHELPVGNACLSLAYLSFRCQISQNWTRTFKNDITDAAARMTFKIGCQRPSFNNCSP